MKKNVINTELERLEDNTVKVTVTIEAPEVVRQIAEAYRQYARQYRFKGFRPGKAPRNVIDQVLGKGAGIIEATNNMLQESYIAALDMNNLVPLSDPQVDAEDMAKDKEPYTYSFTISVKPSVELPSYEPVEVTLPPTEATEAEIDGQLEVLRSYQYTWNEIEDREVAADDYLTLAIDAEAQGEKVEKFCNSSRIYQLGNGILPAAFDEQLIGSKPGEAVQFTLGPTDGLDSTEDVDFTVTVTNIREKVFAELDDEFAQKCGADDLEHLRQTLADGITRSKEQAADANKEDACLLALMERVDVEPPEILVNESKQELQQQMLTQLNRAGLTLDEYLDRNGMDADTFDADLNTQAVDLAKQGMALDALAKHLEIEVTDEDIENEFLNSFDDEDQARKMYDAWRTDGRIPTLREAMMRSKATEWLVENAVVTVASDEEAAPEAEAEAEAEQPAEATEE